MYYLQVVEGRRYAAMADENRISPRLVAPIRGLIVDRFGPPLAVNQKTWRVTVTPERTPGVAERLDRLSRLVAVPDHQRPRVPQAAPRHRAFPPTPLLETDRTGGGTGKRGA